MAACDVVLSQVIKHSAVIVLAKQAAPVYNAEYDSATFTTARGR